MKKVLVFFLVVVGFIACQNEIDDYYDRPDYLRGNAYEFLSERGNFKYFLAAAEKTGYKDALDGRGIYSVFAPDDAAFERYMKKHGISSLDEFNVDSLKLLVGYHLIEYSFSPVDFLKFSASLTVDDSEAGDGSCYKYKTLARENPIELADPITGRLVTVFQQEKFLPVLSTRLLETRESPDFQKDYKFFFPEISWQGDDDQLYVANASIKESGLIIDNGYMYVIDEVIEPLKTVYQVLADTKEGRDYSTFRTLYDRFANMVYDETATKNYAQLGDSLFYFAHYKQPTNTSDLPDLASEWTVSETSQESYENRLKYTFNCFIPTNDAMEQYFNKYFKEFESWEDVPLLTLFYFLKPHAEDRKEIIVPSQIDKGVEGQMGEIWPITTKNLTKSKMCSNGIFYGVDKVLEPAIFSMVPAPLFQYPRFAVFANFFHQLDKFSDFVDPEKEFTLFLVNDEDLKNYDGIVVDYEGNPGNSDILGGRVSFEHWASEQNHSMVSYYEYPTLTETHIVHGFVDQDATERKYFKTQSPYHFVYSEDGRIYGEDGSPAEVKTTWEYNYTNGGGRGMVYEIMKPFITNKENIGKALYKTPKFKKFYQTLLKANLITLEGLSNDQITETTKFKMDWLGNDRCMVFAPTDDVWDEIKLPADSLALDSYLKYYFISLEENKITDYVLPKYGSPTDLKTKKAYTLTEKAMMKIGFVDDKRLRITNESNISTFTDGDVPFFAIDGLIYGITTMLESK